MSQLNLLAQNPSGMGSLGEGSGFGPFTAPTVTGGAGSLIAITKLISLTIGVITVSGGIYFLFQFLIGGYLWLSSSGDKTRLQSAQDRIIHALIGIIIIIAAYAIVSIVGGLLGIDILLKNPCTIIVQLGGSCELF